MKPILLLYVGGSLVSAISMRYKADQLDELLSNTINSKPITEDFVDQAVRANVDYSLFEIED